MFRSGAPPEARYRFKHALVQDAAHESLLKSRRQLLHGNIAEALIQGFPTVAELEPEVIASHFTQAGLAEPAVECWSKAGERASRRSAYVEAIAHYGKAVELADTLPDEPAQRLRRLRLQIAYGQTLIAGHSHGAPMIGAAFARARELAAGIDDPAERASAYYGLWAGSHVRGELAPAQELADALLRDAGRRPGSTEAGLAHRARGMTSWAEGDLVRARAHLEQAVATYDPERDRALGFRLGLDPGVAAMTQLAVVRWQLGDADQANRLAEDGLRLAVDSRHVPTLAYGRGWMCFYQAIRRDCTRVLPSATALVALSREHSLPLWLAFGTFFLDWTRWRTGDRAVGLAGMQGAVASFRDQGLRLYLTFYPVLVAEAEAEAGDVEAALATLAQVAADTERTGQRWFESELHRQRAAILLLPPAADLAAAEASFVRALAVARGQQASSLELRAALGLARLYGATGRARAAQDLLAPLLAADTPRHDHPELEQARRLVGYLDAASVGMA